MPVYILAMDELTGHSTSVMTKLNIIDLSEDDIYKDVSQQNGLNLKLGKDMEFAIPDDVPVVGGLKLTWKIDPFPVTVAYESNDKIDKKISTYQHIEKDEISLEEFLEDITFKIEDYKQVCKNYYEDSLYLMINAKDNENETISYKIPLSLDSCSM